MNGVCYGCDRITNEDGLCDSCIRKGNPRKFKSRIVATLIFTAVLVIPLVIIYTLGERQCYQIGQYRRVKTQYKMFRGNCLVDLGEGWITVNQWLYSK